MSMRALLQESGHRVHGNRADCRNCKGGSRSTVSFTNEVAYCHRCAWTANTVMLSKGLGKTVEPESVEKRAARTKAVRFGQWVDSRHREVSSRYRSLGRMAEIAKDVLIRFPESGAAWAALARFYHKEARLAAMLDVLSFAKASQWLETAATPVALFEKWGASNAR